MGRYIVLRGHDFSYETTIKSVQTKPWPDLAAQQIHFSEIPDLLQVLVMLKP